MKTIKKEEENKMSVARKIEVNQESSVKIQEVSEEQKTLYKTVMSNLKPFMTNEEGKVVQATGMIPLSLCYVDARYQGMRKHKKLKKLINNWDINKLTPIILVPHPETYCFAIVDGQGRFLVAPMKGFDSLNAIVLMVFPSDPYERLVFEAKYFMTQTDESEQVKPVEKHLSRVLVGDKPAVALDNMLNKYGINFVDTKGNRSSSVLGSYTDTYAIAKKNGEDGLDFIFSIIENAGWKEEENGYSTIILRSLNYMYEAHAEYRKEIYDFLSKELRQMDPGLFHANGRASYPKRDFRASCILYTEDLVCNALNIERKIYSKDKDKDKGLKIIK